MARRIAAQIPAGDGVGVVLLLSFGFLSAGSNAFANIVNEAQEKAGEGPGLSSAASETCVRAVFSGDDRRWPVFSGVVGNLGLGSTLSVPLRPDTETLGSVTVCARGSADLGNVIEEMLLEVTSSVVTELGTARLLSQLSVQVRDLSRAFQERNEVDIAVGVLTARYRYSASQARILLDQLARQDGTSVVEAARQVVGPFTDLE